MLDLIDLDAAKLHLNIRHDNFDDEIQSKLDLAHGVVEEYITREDTDWAAEMTAWDDETAPKSVLAAIYVVLGDLWRNRGDQLNGEAPERRHGFLTPQVVSLLHRHRDPVVR